MSNQIHPVFYFHFKTWIFILVEIPNDVHRWYSRFIFGIKVWLYKGEVLHDNRKAKREGGAR